MTKTTVRPDGVVYGNTYSILREKLDWGERSILVDNWDELQLRAEFLIVRHSVVYAEIAELHMENVCIVEAGSGVIEMNGQQYPVQAGKHVIRILPGQTPTFHTDEEMSLFSVQIPVASSALQAAGEDLDNLKIVDVSNLQHIVYEYESLGAEVLTPAYKPGIGLIKFVFPIDKIPIHRHPFSGRLIRVIDGHGYTYVNPDLYEMKKGCFSLFPKNLVHTNGPVPGFVYDIYAFQLPWIESNIDEENIGGDPAFVQYEGPVLPRPLWKRKEDFYRAIKQLSR